VIVVKTDPWRVELLTEEGVRLWSLPGRGVVVRVETDITTFLMNSAEPSAELVAVSAEGNVIRRTSVAGLVTAIAVGDGFRGVRKSMRGQGLYELVAIRVTSPEGDQAVHALGQPDRWDYGVATNGRSLFLGRHQALACLNANDGKEVWSSSMEPVQVDAASGKMWPVVEGTRVIANGAWGIIAFDIETGVRGWHYMDPCWKSVHQGTVYCLSKNYAALDAATGKVLVFSTLAKRVREKFAGKGTGRARGELNFARPTLWGDWVYFGDDMGSLWAIEKTTGEPVWSHKPKGCVGFLNALPVVYGNRLYISSYSFDPTKPSAVYCYEREEPVTERDG